MIIIIIKKDDDDVLFVSLSVGWLDSGQWPYNSEGI